ncbi:MAG: hypothetical protein LBO74_08450 [Candidatus Symbiothrix sp.]|jgi:hypothetical protein|nr:hypothetical protein [Candidatus Symbiothrix sp.]
MIIHFNNTEIDLAVNDNSYRYRAIKQIGSLTLYYSLPQHIEIPLGAWCEFEGATYTLTEPENFKKQNTRNFEYTLILSAPKLDKYKFKDTTSRRLKFPLTAKPHEHLQMLVDNLNQRETGWTVGTCIDAVEKLISYNHAFCSDALSQIADAFETEWEIVGKTINLCKVEYNKENPLPLSYGRGNGFKSGIGRSNTNNSKPVEILFVQGGERNIDASKYGSSELLLPKSQTIGYDGQYFSNQEGYNISKARQYVTDSDGFSLRRSDKALTTQNEDSLDLSNIYPSRIGTISSVNVVNAEKHFYDIIDQSIPANLNFADCLIGGETMTVIFQDGMLAGKEFEVKYIHADRRFEIVPQEIDGRTMPDDIFKPVVGGKYAVFGMMMSDAYICDNATKTGASWDMFREAAKFLYENEEQKFTFTGELDGIWAKKDWLNIGGRIKLGGYVLFSDNQFQPDGVLIRIIGIKDYINNPHSPQIELSNEIVGSSISSDLRKIETNEVIVDELHKDSVQFTKRRFRDSQETIDMLEAALLDKFTNSISPITVQTMAMLVGDESLQFRFVNNTTNPTEVAHNVTFNTETKVLTSPAGIIQHLTLGIDTLSSSHAINEYKFWALPVFNTPPLTDGSKKYYLYAKVSKTATTGVFYISETAIALEGVAGYYHLLMGVLNSEYEGERSYVSLYGFTEILPGRITTDKVVSADGLNFIDFLNNAARIGNANTALEFNINGDGKLRLIGTLVQSQSGDEQPLGCFRGEYNNSYTYYKGDEVTYQGSTYRFIYDTPQSGKVPTNTAYWSVIAARGEPGANGEASDWKTFAYKKSATNPGSPTDTTQIPEGWRDYPDSETTGDDKWWMVVAIVHWTGTEWIAGAFVDNVFTPGQWSEPITVTGEQGTDGQYIDFKFYATTNFNAPNWNDTLASMINPTGWLDQPPQLPLGGAIWMIEAYKQAGGTQLITTWSTPSRISGEKGQDGQDGTDIEYIYQRSTNDEEPEDISELNPVQTDDYVPVGWKDDPQGVNSTYTYEYVSVRRKENGVWGVFSPPAIWAKWGTDGAFFEYRYAKNGSTTAYPSLTSDVANPPGWTTTMPIVGALEYLWMTVSKKSASGELLQNWSTPVRTNGVKGDKGDKGDKGENGLSPAPIFRGEYDSTATYYGTSNRIDIVRYNDTYYVARVDAGSGFTNKVPTNTTYWNTFGAQFDSVATQLLLAENANIAGWVFRNGRLESQSGNVWMNGNTGEINFTGGKIQLKSDGSGQLASGGISWDADGNLFFNSNILDDYNTTNLQFTDSNGNNVVVVGYGSYGYNFNGGIIVNRLFNPSNNEIRYSRLDNNSLLFQNSNRQIGDYTAEFSGSSDGTSASLILNGTSLSVVTLKNLPTSASGLSSGRVWKDSNGYLRIV